MLGFLAASSFGGHCSVLMAVIAFAQRSIAHRNCRGCASSVICSVPAFLARCSREAAWLSGAMCRARAGQETVAAAGRTSPLPRICQAAAGPGGDGVLKRNGARWRRSNGSGGSSRSSRTQNLIRLSVLESLGFMHTLRGMRCLLHLRVFVRKVNFVIDVQTLHDDFVLRSVKLSFKESQNASKRLGSEWLAVGCWRCPDTEHSHRQVSHAQPARMGAAELQAIDSVLA